MSVTDKKWRAVIDEVLAESSMPLHYTGRYSSGYCERRLPRDRQYWGYASILSSGKADSCIGSNTY
jgi:hypothetical protein